ncbi:MAG TPA: adenylosuccinate synthetase [Candidatus Paceibacterota bacterium]|nr:adenylosuccinate synthetase [Candidatus Paceibacterota bacterium]
MHTKQIFTVTDLGGGDGGKGGIVHKIAIETNAHTVLKVGGAQGSHGVRTSRGEAFNFSQWGCGTFEGVPTHVTSLMVIDPVGFVHEGNRLRFQHGVPNAFDMITVDENCLCATSFHGIASRLRELARKGKQKGTVGVGIGEAKLDSELRPDLAIYAKDLGSPDLFDRIEAVRKHKLSELSEIIENIRDLWPNDLSLAEREIDLLNDEGYSRWITAKFHEMKSRTRIVPAEYLSREILSKDGTAVVESSHGVLTDKYYGFHPYVSRLRTLPEATAGLLRSAGYDGEIVRLGVTRAYQIRHGAGPLVTESSELTDKLLPGSHKNENRWQGKVRVGPLDFVALRYAVDVCGGPGAFDGIAVTWFDQILVAGAWRMCDRYLKTNGSEFFSSDGRTINVRRGEDESQIRRQAELAEALFKCAPAIDSHEPLGKGDEAKATELCSAVFDEKLGVPVRMISFGSTEDGKVCL